MVIRTTAIFSRILTGLALIQAAVWMWLPGLAGAQGFNTPLQITTHPGEDFAASVSPDGKFMVYVSDRSGNLDLWMKHLGPGVHSPDRRLTFHSAEDNSPAISPDGKQVVFVSNRSDAKGDIYLLDLTSPDTVAPPVPRLTDAEHMESDPVWSPGQDMVFFTSQQSPSGVKTLFSLNIKTRNRSLILENGGLNPALSPDGNYLVYADGNGKRGLWVLDLRGGSSARLTSDVFMDLSPRWSPDGRRIYFTRFQDDTNFDGRVTIEDNANIWSLGFAAGRPGTERQLTDSSTYDLLASPTPDGKILFTSNRKGNVDVWELPQEGMQPQVSGYEPSLQWVDHVCSEKPPAYLCVLAYQNLIAEFAGEKSLSRVRYQMARDYRELGHAQTAGEIYAEIIQKYPADALYRGLAEVALLLLQVESFAAQGPSVYKQKQVEALKDLEALSSRYADQPSVAARVFLERGNLNAKLNDPTAALFFYQKVIADYSGQREVAAEAAFCKSRVYALVGDRENLVRTFVQVVRDFHDVKHWSEKAVHEILALYEQQPTLEKKVSSLQGMIIEYPEPILLAASVQNRVGELYYQAGENLLAKEAYRKTVDRYATAQAKKSDALLALANIYSAEENFEKSLALYEEIATDFGAQEENLRSARQGLIRKTLAKGDWELRVGEVKLALKTFRKLIDFSPETVEAHRGYLQSSAALGKTGEGVAFYEERLKTRSNSAVEHYGLGLAYTYLNPPALAKAEEEIETALVMDGQQVFFHQTLGWIYEQKDTIGKESGFLERALHEYQIALALNDEKLDPQNEANLLLNLGNGHYLLKNHFTAFHYYRERERSGSPFLDENREAIFWQRYGESAFKSDFPSVPLFERALKRAEAVKDLRRMAELNDRIALAYQDSGQHEQAVEYFSRTLDLHQETGNRVSLARALRNIANNLFEMSRGQKNRDTLSLNRALASYFQAIDNLEQYGVAHKEKEKSALINVDIEVGLDKDASTAALGFDKQGEEKLIFHYIGRIYADFGEYAAASRYFEKKLALIPKDLDLKKNIPVILEKALLLNQLGNFYFHSGNYAQSLRFFRESFDWTRKLENRHGMAVNAANIGRIVLIQCRTQPVSTLRETLLDAVSVLETVVPTNAEYDSILKNDLGMLYHILAFQMDVPAPALTGKQEETFRASLSELQKDFQWAQKSRRSFEEGLALIPSDAKGKERMEFALSQNLTLTQRLMEKVSGEQAASPPPESRWQVAYLNSVLEEGDRRLPLLIEAENDLSRLPYGPRDISTVTMMGDLYAAITRLLFEKKEYATALSFSEKGKQQILNAMEPAFLFKDEDRQGYYKEVLNLSRHWREASDPQERQAIQTEYDEFLEMMGEDDPELTSLFVAQVTDVEEWMQKLRPGQILLKFQKTGDEILIWEVNASGVQGTRVVPEPPLNALIAQIGREGKGYSAADLKFLADALLAPVGKTLAAASSLLIVADGELEYLPWPAMLGGDLLGKIPLTFLSSLSHFHFAESKKNLFNSRILTVETALPEKAASAFASALALSGDAATRENFQGNWEHFGVVHIGSPVRLRGDGTTYISLTGKENHFERISLGDVFSAGRMDVNFIAFADAGYQFHPEVNLSPSASLLRGLTLAGYPGVLLHTGPSDPNIHAEFLDLFYSNFRKSNPAESLRDTLSELARRYPDSPAWAGYRFYGFPGMDDEEKRAFAVSGFKEIRGKAIDALKNSDWLAATGYLEKALRLTDYLPEGERVQKDIYKALTQASYNKGDFQKGIYYQEKLVPLAEADSEALAESSFFLGILYSKAERWSDAVGQLQKALAIYEKLESLDQVARSYSELGKVRESALEYGPALEAFIAAGKISEEIGEEFDRGRELRRIGTLYYLRLNQYPEADRYFAEAQKLFAELESAEQLAETILERGLVAEKQGDFVRALDFYQQGQALAEASSLQISLAKALHFQGNTHWFQGDYQKAFRFQRQALEVAEAVNDERLRTLIFNTLGLIHWTLNDSTRALENLEHSLERAERIHSLPDIASAYNNIGLVHRKEKQYEKSIQFFNEAMKRDVQLKSKWGQGYTHRNLGMSYLRMNRLDEAEAHIEQAVALSQEIGNRTNQAKSMLELGNLSLAREHWEEAIPRFREAGELAEKLNIPEVEWRALRGEGFALVQLGQRLEAVGLYEKSVAVVDRMRAAIKVEEFQNGFLTDKQDVYQELILLLLDMGQVEQSFTYAERAKSRSFIDLLGNQKISLKNDVGRKLYESLNGQKQMIRTLEESLGAVRAKGDDKQATELAEQLVKARTRYQDLLIEAKEQSPEISSFITVDSISLDRLHTLLEETVVLVEYLVTEKELVAWVVTHGDIRSVRIPVASIELSAVIKDYRDRMQHFAPLDEPSQKLYAWLIKPVEPFISGKRVLGIIPHGPLHYLSFASLSDGENYLIEKHPLFYSPSASVLEFTFKRKFTKGELVKVLALGNPDLGDLNYDLPLAEMEANAIRWDFPQIDVLTREKATESWLQKHIGDYQIIHIGSHGEFDPVNPLFSSLKLTRDESADGNFEVNEVFSLDINADLVTLSACQTGLGEITGGDELVGLNRAFIYAGTHAILSSLWRVSDISTAVMVKYFYRNYVTEDKAESLRNAQLLVKKQYAHPSYWAGFSLTGDYR